MSDKEISEFICVYNTWYAYIKVENKQANTDRYCTIDGYSRVRSNMIPNAAIIRYLP